jgi:hypothetical protein
MTYQSTPDYIGYFKNHYRQERPQGNTPMTQAVSFSKLPYYYFTIQ